MSPVAASYADAAPLSIGGVTAGCRCFHVPVQTQVLPSAANRTSLCAAGSPTNVTPDVDGPSLNVPTFFQEVPFQVLSIPLQQENAGNGAGALLTQPWQVGGA